jgi:hypothetical protein
MSIDQPLVVEPQVTPQRLCKNCDAPLSGRYCSQCGQADKSLDPSFHDLLHEGIHEFLHLDGKLVATLKALLFRPGRLTVEHFRGRRARYIGAIRLYLTLSVIFFIIAAHANESTRGELKLDSSEQKISIEAPNAAGNNLAKRLTGGLKKAFEDPELFRHAFLGNMSRVMFVMVPLFALGLRIAYRNRERRYPGFVYFSLHYHSLIFFALIVSDLVWFTHVDSLSTWTNLLVILWCLVYLFLALRKVFGGTWRSTALRIAALGVVYVPCFAIGMGVAGIVSLFTL